MGLILYINGVAMDVFEDQVIAQTKQVNDMATVEGRNSNYTNNFKLPKTSRNLAALQYMTVPGNTSDVPYQKNECTLLSATGECFIYKGWTLVEDRGDYIECAVIDGSKDFFKEIENKSLSDLDLSELTHRRTIPNVIDSWNTSKPYRYILADYNGNTGNVNPEEGIMPEVNIDYLVPSVNVAWLWQKIQQRYGVAFIGDVFNDYNFTELWMTYPKGEGITEENDHDVFKSDDFTPKSPTANSYYFSEWNSSDINELNTLIAKRHMKVADAGTYKVKVKGKLLAFRGASSQSSHRSAKIYLTKNRENATIPNSTNTPIFKLVQDNIPHGEDFEFTSDNFILEELDSVCAIITGGSDENVAFNFLNGYTQELEIELIRVDPNIIDFGEAFTDFGIKDFFNDIINRFGLTLFKDKYEPLYTFLTYREQFINAETVDWSKKFIKKNAEKYTLGEYARRNWFRYNYNDKEGSHNDYYFEVANVNLKDRADVFKSKIYSPERVERLYLNKSSKVYKMWDKEIVENPEEGEAPVNYTPLDKRYYLMRSSQRTGNIKVISGNTPVTATTGLYYSESYYRLRFQDIIQDYYTSFQQVLYKTMVIDADLNLNDLDVLNFDFKKLYWIEALNNYFKVNRINNYIPGRTTKCELIRVQFEELEAPPQGIVITKVVTYNKNVTVTYTMAIQAQSVMFQYRLTTQTTWHGMIQTDNPFTINLPTGSYEIRVVSAGVESNSVLIHLPSYETIEP